MNLCQQIEYGVLSLRSLEIVCSLYLDTYDHYVLNRSSNYKNSPSRVFCGLYLMLPVDEIRIELADVKSAIVFFSWDCEWLENLVSDFFLLQGVVLFKLFFYYLCYTKKLPFYNDKFIIIIITCSELLF